MNDMSIKVFESNEFGTVRTDIDENGDIIFCAKDVAIALGYSNTKDAIIRHCHGVVKRDLIDSLGRTQAASFIPESDVYRLAFSSKLPNAERFTDWVTKEILPDIRKHGMYMTGEKLAEFMADPYNAGQVLLAYAAEKEKSKQLAAAVAERDKTIKIMQPKVEFSDAVNSSHDGILVKQMANLLTQNGYSTGQNRLFEQLRNDGFVCSSKGARFNTPMQSSIDRGLMISREIHYNDPNGITHLNFTTLITPKGQRYFLQKYAGKILSDEEIAAMLEAEESVSNF